MSTITEQDIKDFLRELHSTKRSKSMFIGSPEAHKALLEARKDYVRSVERTKEHQNVLRMYNKAKDAQVKWIKTTLKKIIKELKQNTKL